MFKDSINNKGPFAAVFEFEDGAGYFYLLDSKNNGKVVAHKKVCDANLGFAEDDITFEWGEEDVSMCIFGKKVAAVDFPKYENNKNS